MADYFQLQTPQVSWTLSEQLIYNIGNLFQRASDNFVRRNYAEYFDCLKEIKNRAIQSFNEEERQKFEVKEKEVLRYLANWGSNDLKTNHFKLWVKINNALYEVISGYNILLMDCLNKYGYLIPPKKDKTRLIG